MPGAIAATPVEAPIDVEEGTLPADVPLVYFYGHASPAEGPELYAHLVERLAAVLERRVCFLGPALGILKVTAVGSPCGSLALRAPGDSPMPGPRGHASPARAGRCKPT